MKVYDKCRCDTRPRESQLASEGACVWCGIPPSTSGVLWWRASLIQRSSASLSARSRSAVYSADSRATNACRRLSDNQVLQRMDE
jgi:hypothetical protein